MKPVKGIQQDLSRCNDLCERIDTLVTERAQTTQQLNALYAHCWDSGEWAALEDVQELRDLYVKTTSSRIGEVSERLTLLRWNLEQEPREAMVENAVEQLTKEA